MTQLRLPFLSVVLALVLEAASARGAEPDAHQLAAQSYGDAQSAFAQRQYAASATAYERAAKYEVHPQALLNAAEAWELAGEPARAASDCDTVLGLPDVVERYRADAELRLGRLAKRIATVELRGEGPLLVSVDETAQQRGPARVRVHPGVHVVRIVDTRSGRTIRRDVHLAPGQIWTFDTELMGDLAEASPGANEPMARPVERLPTDMRSGTASSTTSKPVPTLSLVAFGLGGAAAVTSGVFGALTVGAHDEFDRSPTEARADSFDRYKLVTNVALGVTVASLITGLVVYWTGHR